MAKIDLPKQAGKWSKVRDKSVKSQGILKTILSGNPARALFAKKWESYNTKEYSLLQKIGVPLTPKLGVQNCKSSVSESSE